MDESSLALAGHLAEHRVRAPLLLLLTTRPPRLPQTLERPASSALVLGELSRSRVAGDGARGAGRDRPPRRGRRRDLRQDEGQPALPRGGHPLAAGARRARPHPRVLVGDACRGARPRSRSPTGSRACSCRASTGCRPTPGRCSRRGRSSAGPSTRACWPGSADPLAAGVSARSRVRRADRGRARRARREADGRAVTFRHALVQDVAYESLPFSRRRACTARGAATWRRSRRRPTTPCSCTTTAWRATRRKTRLHAVLARGLLRRGVREP